MADNLEQRGPQDRARINVHEAWERRWWSKKFGVSEDDLRAAVGAVGVMAKDVAKHLGVKAE